MGINHRITIIKLIIVKRDSLILMPLKIIKNIVMEQKLVQAQKQMMN